MSNPPEIERAATDRSPFVRFRPDGGTLEISGESYPEDAASFFGPLLKAVQDFLDQPGCQTLRVDLRMSYFNSSSAKAFMNMFQALEDAAADGKAEVEINWHFDPDDETMEEFGEDFAEDFKAAVFSLRPSEDA